jgi:hypothetical protein
MTVPTCPEHGSLMSELAAGRLDPESGARAEELRVGCADCARWWNRTFSDAALHELDAAVAESFASFAPPARRRSGWWAVAAAAVLALGIGAASLLWDGGTRSPVAAAAGGNTGTEIVLSTFDFEGGTVEPALNTPAREAAPVATHSTSDAVFSNDLESGDLSSWSAHG